MARPLALAATLSLGAIGGLAGPAAAAASFEGRYAAGDDAYSQSLTVTRTGGSLRGRVEVATSGCVGTFDGRGTPKGDTLLLRARQDGRECRLTLRRTAPAAIVLEEDGCLTFHGSACAFSGTYKRQAR